MLSMWAQIGPETTVVHQSVHQSYQEGEGEPIYQNQGQLLLAHQGELEQGQEVPGPGEPIYQVHSTLFTRIAEDFPPT